MLRQGRLGECRQAYPTLDCPLPSSPAADLEQASRQAQHRGALPSPFLMLYSRVPAG